MASYWRRQPLTGRLRAIRPTLVVYVKILKGEWKAYLTFVKRIIRVQRFTEEIWIIGQDNDLKSLKYQLPINTHHRCKKSRYISNKTTVIYSGLPRNRYQNFFRFVSASSFALSESFNRTFVYCSGNAKPDSNHFLMVASPDFGFCRYWYWGLCELGQCAHIEYIFEFIFCLWYVADRFRLN